MKGRNYSAVLLSNRRVVKAGMMLSAASMVGLMSAGHAKGASGSWGGAAGDGQWSSASNWTSQPGNNSTGFFTSGDTATFAVPNTSAGVVTVDSGRNIKSL